MSGAWGHTAGRGAWGASRPHLLQLLKTQADAGADGQAGRCSSQKRADGPDEAGFPRENSALGSRKWRKFQKLARLC